MKDVVYVFAFLFLIVFAMTTAVTCLVGCVKKTAMEAYTADLLACTDNSDTRLEAEACESKVDAKWGVRLDGGADARH